MTKDEVIKDAENLCKKFVAKVETGNARSKETYADCKKLLRSIESHNQEGSEEYEQLKDLTVTIWKMFYREEAPEFEPLDDILGLITQIDNMVTGLERRRE